MADAERAPLGPIGFAPRLRENWGSLPFGAGIGTVRQWRPIEFAQKRLPGRGELAFQPTTRREHAAAAIVAKAFDQGMPGLQRPHDLAETDGLRRARQAKAAAAASLRCNKTSGGEIAYHFYEVMARDAKLSGNFARRE